MLSRKYPTTRDMAEGNCSSRASFCQIPVSCIRSLNDGVSLSHFLGERRRLTEAQVSAINDPPAYETTDGRQVDQPAEDGRSTVEDSHEGQEGEERLSVHALSLLPVHPNEGRLTQKATAMNGSPPFVTRLKILGA